MEHRARNQRSGVRGQTTEDSGQIQGDGETRGHGDTMRRSENRGRRSEVGSQRTEARGQKPEDKKQQAVWLSVISYLLFGRSVGINCLNVLNDLNDFN